MEKLFLVLTPLKRGNPFNGPEWELDILPIQSYPCSKLEIYKGEKQT